MSEGLTFLEVRRLAHEEAELRARLGRLEILVEDRARAAPPIERAFLGYVAAPSGAQVWLGLGPETALRDDTLAESRLLGQGRVEEPYHTVIV